MSDDEDCPPPLSSLVDQVQAIRLRGTPQAQIEAGDGSNLPTAALTLGSSAVQIPDAAPQIAAAIKKGFFDAKPAKPKAAAATPKLKGPDDGITELRGAKAASGLNGPRIPDFLKLEPDEREREYARVKGKMVEALKPTPDMINKLAQNPDLMAGFEDPEVMAAVSDVASNPANIKKYAGNKKVQKFYEGMGMMMGEKLEAMKGGIDGIGKPPS